MISCAHTLGYDVRQKVITFETGNDSILGAKIFQKYKTYFVKPLEEQLFLRLISKMIEANILFSCLKFSSIHFNVEQKIL